MIDYIDIKNIPVYENWCKIPKGVLKKESIIYNFGVGESIAFEYSLSGLTGCKIFHFDPTPRSATHFELCQNLLKLNADEAKKFIINNRSQKFGGGDKNYLNYVYRSRANHENVFFYPKGLYDEDKKTDFFLPKNPNFVSLSIDNLQNTKDKIVLEVRKIDTIMKDLNHDKIDVMKLNIEGAEVKSLIHMLENTNVRPTYICVKMELLRDKPCKETLILQEKLNRMINKFYKIIYRKENIDFTFQLLSCDN